MNARRSNLLLAAAIGASAVSPVAFGDPFYMGADVSLLPFIESKGGTFTDGSQAQPADQILADNGANLFRLRLFVNPNLNYSATSGAIQDLNYDIALAQRLKASGAKILLDLHYSDTWADPSHQAKPAAWNSLDFASLNTTVRNYTRDTLLAFKNAGVMPEMVQVGNETTNGMLYGPTVIPPSGGRVVYTGSTTTQNQSWMNFGSLLNSAISGVRDADATIPGRHTQVAIHVDGGDVSGRAQYYYNQLTNVAGVSPSSYDVMGMSFYPDSDGSVSFNNLKSNLNYLATHYDQKLMVLEANQPWKGSSNGTQWAVSPEGQRQFLADVRDAVKALPNDRGQGVVWWYPESVQVPGTTIWQGGAVALFDDDTDGGGGPDAHGTLPAVDEFSLPAPTWALDADGVWSGSANWQLGVPGGAGQTARFTGAISAPRTITVDTPRSVGTLSFLSTQSYTLVGAPSAGTLTLDAASGPAAITVLAGNHTIAAPVVLADNTDIVVAWNNTLTLSGPLSAAGKTITKYGSGTVQFENVRAGQFDVEFGSVRIREKSNPNDVSGTSSLQSLLITQGTSLDLMNNALIVDYDAASAAPLAEIRAHLASGRLTSSAADSGSRRLGYIDNAPSPVTEFGGLPVDSSSVLVGYVFAGDSNLNGRVDIVDLGNLAGHWQLGADAIWSAGDFNYDGVVNIVDLGILASNWQAGAGGGGASLEASLAALGLPNVAIPEPVIPATTILLACAFGRGASPTRRRRQ